MNIAGKIDLGVMGGRICWLYRDYPAFVAIGFQPSQPLRRSRHYGGVGKSLAQISRQGISGRMKKGYFRDRVALVIVLWWIKQGFSSKIMMIGPGVIFPGKGDRRKSNG